MKNIFITISYVCYLKYFITNFTAATPPAEQA